MPKQSKREHVSDLFDLLSKTRFQIFTFLNMYGKLSLTEIAQKLNKSKSTIHGHIRKMKDANALIEEKRPTYSDPNSDKPKVFENVYTINPEFGTEFEDVIPGLNLEKLTVEQAKIILDTFIFITKMKVANLKIQSQFYKKIENSFETEPEKMRDLTKKLLFGVFNPKCTIGEDTSNTLSQFSIEDKEFPALTIYIHLSPQQFNKFSEKFGDLCKLFLDKDFTKVAGEEKPITFMATAMPIKNFIEFLNE